MQNDLSKEALSKNNPSNSTPRVSRRRGHDKGVQHRASVQALDINKKRYLYSLKLYNETSDFLPRLTTATKDCAFWICETSKGNAGTTSGSTKNSS